MSPEQFAQNLKHLQQAIQDNGPRIAETMAVTGKSLAQDRVQREGVGKYSTKYIPAYYLKGKELNSRGAAFLEDNNMDDDLVNWGEFRRAQGLQTDHVDLTYSGRMFGGTRPIQHTVQGASFHVVIGGTDKEVDDKLYYNTQRYGDFLEPNAEERKEIDEIVEDAFEELIEKYLND